MKSPFIFLLLLGFAASCAPEPDPSSRPENALTHDPVTQQLTAASPSYTLKAQLTCGCRFMLHVEGAGDTSVIKYTIPPLDSIAAHDITVSASTTGLAKGTYSSWLALWSYDWEKGMLRDTIFDTLVIP